MNQQELEKELETLRKRVLRLEEAVLQFTDNFDLVLQILTKLSGVEVKK